MFNNYIETDNNNSFDRPIDQINYAINNSLFDISNNNIQLNNNAPGLDYIGYISNQTINANVTVTVKKEQYWAIILIIFPIVTFLGNMLVILSIIKEKNLRTVTNYFVVSLATADLLVSALVMPFAVYLEVDPTLLFF